MTLRRWFTEHPGSVGESYFEHAVHAAGFGVTMLRGSLAGFVHAVAPALCTTTGSRIITRLHDRMVLSRASLRVKAQAQPAQECFLAEHI